jgi:WD40 repeat-containing protein SMU1
MPSAAQMLYVFSMQSGKLEHMTACHDKEPIGLCHHPHKNVLATFASDSALKLWRP